MSSKQLPQGPLVLRDAGYMAEGEVFIWVIRQAMPVSTHDVPQHWRKTKVPWTPNTSPLLFLTATGHQNSCLNLPLTSKWAAMLANLRFPCPPSFPWPLSDAPHNHLSPPQRWYPCLLREPPVLCGDIQPVLEMEAQSPKCLFHITMLCLICPSILPQKSQNILFHYWHTHEFIFSLSWNETPYCYFMEKIQNMALFLSHFSMQ